jgi:hypothetical protein
MQQFTAGKGRLHQVMLHAGGVRRKRLPHLGRAAYRHRARQERGVGGSYRPGGGAVYMPLLKS